MLRRSKTISLPADDDFADDTSQFAEEELMLPQQPSIDEPLVLDRRLGADRRSQDEIRTEFQRTLAMAHEHGTLPRPISAGNFGKNLRIALIVIALVAGGAAAWLATRSPSPAPEVAVAAPVVPVPTVPMVKVLVAARAIGLGERLSAGAVAWQNWPQANVQSGFITDAVVPDALASMGGDVARSEFVVGEPILDGKLVKTDEGYLSAVLATGMRGVSVSVTADAASGGFIVPNDHVDVVLSRNSDAGQRSQTILTDVRVLAINTRLGQTGETGAPPATDPASQIFSNTAIATLELDPTQAEIIVNATQAGKLSLVLRSLADSKGSANAAETAANQAIRMTSPFWAK